MQEHNTGCGKSIRIRKLVILYNRCYVAKHNRVLHGGSFTELEGKDLVALIVGKAFSSVEVCTWTCICLLRRGKGWNLSEAERGGDRLCGQ